MKRISAKNRQEAKLQRRLELVRITIRELTPTQLEQVNGGTDTVIEENPEPWCPPWPTG